MKSLHLVVIHKLLHLIEDEFLQGCFPVLSLVHCGQVVSMLITILLDMYVKIAEVPIHHDKDCKVL